MESHSYHPLITGYYSNLCDLSGSSDLLILGARGFIGGNLVPWLKQFFSKLELDFPIYIADKSDLHDFPYEFKREKLFIIDLASTSKPLITNTIYSHGDLSPLAYKFKKEELISTLLRDHQCKLIVMSSGCTQGRDKSNSTEPESLRLSEELLSQDPYLYEKISQESFSRLICHATCSPLTILRLYS